jgi:hypothetical protein
VFNSLPSQIKELCHNRNQFKHALKNLLYFHSFYTLDEDSFGGLVVSMLASGTQVHGFKPGQSHWIFTEGK